MTRFLSIGLRMAVGTKFLFGLVVYLPTLYFGPTIGVVSTAARTGDLYAPMGWMFNLIRRRSIANDDAFLACRALDKEAPS